jgi:hypothetical protein
LLPKEAKKSKGWIGKAGIGQGRPTCEPGSGASAMPAGPCKLEVVIRGDSVDRRIIREITVGGEDAPKPAGKPLPATAPAR